MDRTISISACGMNKRQVIAIGRQMENNYRQIIFDCSGFGVEVASVTLVHLRSQDVAPYIVDSSSTDQLTWTITNTDTAYPGYGKAELRISFTNGLAKSVVFTTMVIQSITADTTIPQPLQSWYDAMIDYIDDHSVSPEQIEEAVAEYLDEHPVQAPVQSVNGKQGTVVLTASDIGALPDSTQIPTKTSQLQNDSGFLTSAPVQSVNGETGAVVITASDLGALTSESDPVFSASAAAGITSADITTWNGKYTKPSGGVPVSDLNSTAQSRLMPTGGTTGQVLAKKSNSNYDTEWVNQSGGGGAVDSVNGQTGTVVLDASDVGALPDTTTASDLGAYVKPTGGIPKSDLASAVQASLDKADTALQTAPVTSVNGQTGAVAVAVPTKTSELQNDSGFLTSAPVSSVDGKTGAVTVLPSGGSTGQVLAKASATDRDVEWITPSGGGGSEWKQVVKLQTTEDATSIILTEDDDGNALSFDEAYVIIMTSRESSASANGNFSISLVDEWFTSFNGYGLYNHGLFSDVYKFVFHITHDGVLATITLTEKSRVANTLSALTYWASEITWSGTNRIGINGNSAVSVSSTRVITDLLDSAGKICAVSFGVDNVNAVKFATGTRVEMWCK